MYVHAIGVYIRLLCCFMLLFYVGRKLLYMMDLQPSFSFRLYIVIEWTLDKSRVARGSYLSWYLARTKRYMLMEATSSPPTYLNTVVSFVVSFIFGRYTRIQLLDFCCSSVSELFVTEYSSCFISVMNLDLHVGCLIPWWVEVLHADRTSMCIITTAFAT